VFAIVLSASEPSLGQYVETPSQATTEAEIERLIQQLGDPDFALRDQAQRKLAEMGAMAYNALTVAAHHSDLEIAARARYLMRTVDVPVVRADDPDDVKLLLKEYTEQSTAQRIRTMRLLLALPDGRGYGPVCRLVHVEKSPLMAKFAAIELLNGWPLHTPGRDRIDAAIEEELRNSGCPTAQWLRSYAALAKEPTPGLDAWAGMAAEEAGLLERLPAKSDPQVAATLYYHLALQQLRCGDDQEAEASFRTAQQLSPVLIDEVLYFHLGMASFFQLRGRFDWAVAEYDFIADAGNVLGIAIARISVAEMYHDIDLNQEAADALEIVLDLGRRHKNLRLADLRQSREQLAARRQYFLACQARLDGDEDQHRTYLEQALKEDPHELDALIAAWRLSESDAEWRQVTKQRIEVAAARLRRDAAKSPKDPSDYNQYAWLVGNTTGDMKEALRHAEHAIHLRPESGAYRDTLAHVYYYGLDDQSNAIKQQTLAAQFMPHSGLIKKKLELFRTEPPPRRAPRAADGETAEGTP